MNATSFYLGNIDCSGCDHYTDMSIVKKFDDDIYTFVHTGSNLIKDGEKNFSNFSGVKDLLDGKNGLYACIKFDSVPVLEITVYGKAKLIITYKDTMLLDHKVIQGNKDITYEELSNIFYMGRKAIANSIRLFVNAINTCIVKEYKSTDDVYTAFLKCYKNTGKPLKKVVSELQAEGYSKKDIMSAVLSVLADVTWEE